MRYRCRRKFRGALKTQSEICKNKIIKALMRLRRSSPANRKHIIFEWYLLISILQFCLPMIRIIIDKLAIKVTGQCVLEAWSHNNMSSKFMSLLINYCVHNIILSIVLVHLATIAVIFHKYLQVQNNIKSNDNHVIL